MSRKSQLLKLITCLTPVCHFRSTVFNRPILMTRIKFIFSLRRALIKTYHHISSIRTKKTNWSAACLIGIKMTIIITKARFNLSMMDIKSQKRRELLVRWFLIPSTRSSTEAMEKSIRSFTSTRTRIDLRLLDSTLQKTQTRINLKTNLTT